MSDIRIGILGSTFLTLATAGLPARAGVSFPALPHLTREPVVVTIGKLSQVSALKSKRATI
jgi:hypothetical protein